MVAAQWLLPAYVRSITALGATAPIEKIEECGQDLIERWSSPDRRFHDIAHLAAVLERVDELAQETHHPELVRIAAWYHGAVFDASVHKGYNRAIGENKDASADHALYTLQSLGIPSEKAERVSTLIRGLTRHDSDPTDVDAMALCDADLGILAADPQRYREYRTRVREEFDHVDPLTYLRTRTKIITALLARPRLFLSPLADRWEEAGRQNLTAELSRLKKECAKLAGTPTDHEVHSPDTAVSTGILPAVRSRFAPDGTRGETQSLPVVRKPAVARTSDAEVVGVPFEDRPKAVRNEIKEWGIERTPEDERDLPRRKSILHQPTTAATSAASPPEARRTARPSTSDSADESTVSLFRPIEDI